MERLPQDEDEKHRFKIALRSHQDGKDCYASMEISLRSLLHQNDIFVGFKGLKIVAMQKRYTSQYNLLTGLETYFKAVSPRWNKPLNVIFGQFFSAIYIFPTDGFELMISNAGEK